MFFECFDSDKTKAELDSAGDYSKKMSELETSQSDIENFI